MNNTILRSILRAEVGEIAAQRGLFSDQLVQSSKPEKRPCSQAPPLSATPVLLTRLPSAAGYTISTCRLLGSPTKWLSAHRLFKTKARPSSTCTLSTREARRRKPSTISTPTASMGGTLAQCVPRAAWLVLSRRRPFAHTRLSWPTWRAVQRTSWRVL